MAQQMMLPAKLDAILSGISELSKRMAGLEERVAGLESQIALQQHSAVEVPALPLSKYRRDRRFVFACYLQHLSDVIRMLDEGADVNAEVDVGQEIWQNGSDYQVARAADTREGVNEHTFEDDWPHGFYTPLLAAFEFGYKDEIDGVSVINLLIRQGAFVNVATGKGCTPLMFAAKYSQDTVFDLLVKFGARVDAVDDGNLSALHYLCSGFEYPWTVPVNRRVKIAKKLIGAGLDVNAFGECFHGDESLGLSTPLILAAGTDVRLIKFLLKSGADITATDSNMRTALHVAASSGRNDCVEALVLADADVNAICTHSHNSKFLATHFPNSSPRLPLHLCCRARMSANTIELMLAHGADPNGTSRGGTALIWASGELTGCARTRRYSAHMPNTDFLPPVQIISLLLVAGARPNKSNEDGETALHKSATFGDLAACKVLLSYGANLFAKDKDGRTPLGLYGTKQSLSSFAWRADRVPALTPAEKAEHVAALFEARREYLASNFVEALRSGRVLIAPCAQDPRGFVPRTVRNTVVGHAVLSNRDLVKAITEWL